MKLYTERRENDYERIVDILVNKSSNSLPYINDPDTCKLIVIKTGTVQLSLADASKTYDTISAPSAVFVSNNDRMKVSDSSNFTATTVFFKPTAIDDSFTYDRLYQNEFESLFGTTLYQDYLAIRNFIIKDASSINYIHLTDTALIKIMELITKIDSELHSQYDDYWPCRSRSFFIELLFFLNFCYNNDPFILSNKQKFTTTVIEYLEEHIDEKISLDSLTKMFHVNRNYLNSEFMKDTGHTCLSYFLKLKLDLAKLLLTETEIPICEIGQRIGYPDSNYFAKVFHKECGVSPSKYRNEQH